MMNTFFKSFLYAFKGLMLSFSSERNLKVQAVVALLTLGGGFYFRISSIEWCIVLFAIGMVLGMELLNTAVEKTVDLITKERNPLAGNIKDIAAGAVLLVSLVAVLVGGIVFWKYLF